MQVKILYLGLIRNKIGKKEEEYRLKKGSSLSDLLNQLTETYGKNLKQVFESDKENRLDPTVVVMLNGALKDPLCGRDVIIRDGDVVSLMTLISGG